MDSLTSHWASGTYSLRSMGFWGHKGDSTICKMKHLGWSPGAGCTGLQPRGAFAQERGRRGRGTRAEQSSPGRRSRADAGGGFFLWAKTPQAQSWVPQDSWSMAGGVTWGYDADQAATRRRDAPRGSGPGARGGGPACLGPADSPGQAHLTGQLASQSSAGPMLRLDKWKPHSIVRESFYFKFHLTVSARFYFSPFLGKRDLHTLWVEADI